jgi:hypothetical protein
MALQAKLRSFLLEHEFLWTSVRAVTPGALSRTGRFVDEIVLLLAAFHGLVIVALVAQIRLRLHQHLPLPGVGGVTRRTLPVVGYRGVDHLVLGLERVCRIVMTFKAYVHASLGKKSRGFSRVGIVAIGARVVIGDRRVDHGSLELVVTHVAELRSLLF